MAQKLKSLFQERPLALALKAAFFAVFLIFARIGDFGLIPILFFFIAAIILYTSSRSDGPAYFISFTGLVILSLVITSKLGENVSLIFIFLASAFLFYILLGLKNLFFIYRARWYYLLQLVLLYSVALLFFLMDKSGFFFLKSLFIFAILFILLWEFFRLINKNYDNFLINRVNPSLLAGIASLLIIESFWAISLLPISFLNSANLGLLVIFVIIDLLSRYNQNNLSYRILLTNITIFIIAAILIFAVSAWSI